MQRVLVTVFKTDSVALKDKHMDCDVRFVFRKAQISIVTQLQRIVVASWFVAVCVHCLFLMVPWVGLESVIMFFLVILIFNYTFQLTKIKTLIRLHGCAGCSVASFFAYN